MAGVFENETSLVETGRPLHLLTYNLMLDYTIQNKLNQYITIILFLSPLPLQVPGVQWYHLQEQSIFCDLLTTEIIALTNMCPLKISPAVVPTVMNYNEQVI